jgi:hypothetical protein
MNTPLLWAQTLAAFGTPASQHCAPTLGGHAGPKSMRTRAAHFARLVGTFHDFKALKTERKMGRQGTQRRTACQYNRFRGITWSV